MDFFEKHPLVFPIMASIIMQFGLKMLVFSLFALFQVSGHAILATILWNRAKTVDLKSKAAITSFYMFVWKVTQAIFFMSKTRPLLFCQSLVAFFYVNAL